MVFERFGRDPGWSGFIAELARLFVPAQNTNKKFILVNLNTHIYMLSLLFIFHKAGKEKRIEKRSARSSTNNQLFKYSVRTLFVLYFVQLNNRIG